MARAGRPRPTQREAIIANTMQARGGLGQMLAQQGAGKDITDAMAEIESVPGGVELLYTLAAEELMKRQGISKKDAKKIRLYAIGGPVYAEGGSVRQAAAKTRRAGGEDSMMLHVSPEEYETIEAMWGPAEINPETGIGEYGFLRKIFKKVKKAVKKVVKSKIFQVVAPIALSIFAPGLGTAIGAALTGGGTGLVAGALGNAVVQGGLGAVSGGKEGFLRGAVMGGVTGGLGKMAGAQVSKVAPGLSTKTANIIGSSLASGVGSELTGGDFTSGAIMGGLQAFTQPGLESMAEKTRGALGFREEPGRIFARRGVTAPGVAPPAYTPSGEVGPPVPEALDPTFVGPPTPAGYTPPAPTGAPAGDPAGGFDLGAMAPLALAALPLLGSGGSESVEGGPPPDLPPEFYEDLPVYTMNRQFQGLPSPEDYYTYGQFGAPQSGQHLFITPPGPFGGIGPIGSEEAPGPLGQAVPPREVIPGAGRIPRRGRMRNQPAARGGYQRGGEFDFWAQNEDVARISPSVSAQGRYVKGAGTGRSDDIEALLSDGEYVVDAESVALLGDGSGDAGAQRLDEMRANLRRHKAKKLKAGEFSHKAKRPEQYMGRLRAAAGRA